MAKLLLNADGKVLTSNDKVLKAPESTLKKLLDAKKTAESLFSNYTGESVDNIISYNDTENITSAYDMFNGCVNLKEIPPLNTSRVESMNSMFSNCNNLQTIPQLDTSNVTNMANMFYCCFKLQTIPQLDTSKVVGMSNMFASSGLKTIPQLDTSNVTNTGNMFYSCTYLQTIDLTSLDKVSSTGYMSNMFYGCGSLTKLIIRTMTVIPPLNTNSFKNCYRLTGTVNSYFNPEGLKDGRIYAPDDKVEELKQATNWSVYADIIVPLSTLQEE